MDITIEAGSTWESVNRGHRTTLAKVRKASGQMVEFWVTTKGDPSHRGELLRMMRNAFLARYRRRTRA